MRDVGNTEVFIAFFVLDEVFSQAWTHSSLCLVTVFEGVKYCPQSEKMK